MAFSKIEINFFKLFYIEVYYKFHGSYAQLGIDFKLNKLRIR